MQPTRSLNLNHTGIDFPGDLVVKTSPYNSRDVGLIPGQGAEIFNLSEAKDLGIKAEAML